MITISADPLAIFEVLILEGPSILGHERKALVIRMLRVIEMRRRRYAASMHGGFGLGDGFGLGGLVGGHG